MNSAPPPAPPNRRWGLQPKLILSMLLVGMVPLIVGLGLAFWQGSREIQVVSGESFKALAEETARKVDLLMSDEVSRSARIVADPSIIMELEQRREIGLIVTDRRIAKRLQDTFESDWEAAKPKLEPASAEQAATAPAPSA